MSHQSSAHLALRTDGTPTTKATRAMKRAVVFLSFAAAGCAVSPSAPARYVPVARPAAVEAPLQRVVIPTYVRFNGPMDFYMLDCWGVDPRCPNFIFAVGEITPGTAERFQAFAARVNSHIAAGVKPGPGPWAVVLDSPGGNLVAGMQLGWKLRQLNWNTVVGVQYPANGSSTVAVCASACVYSFVGGVHRVVLRDNVLAVHQFYSDRRMTVGDVQRTTAVIDVYLTAMGASPLLQALAGITPSQNVAPLTIKDAVTLGVATAS
jgi:hypothetical protein